MRSLTTDRQPLAMPQSAETAEVHQALDVHRHFAPQIAFDLVSSFDHFANPARLVIGEILGSNRELNSSRCADVVRGFLPDAVDVLKRDHHPLLRGEIDASDTSHILPIPSS